MKLIFIEDDADEMVRIIEKVFTDPSMEYRLSKKETGKIIDRFREEIDRNTLKKMFASKERQQYASIG